VSGIPNPQLPRPIDPRLRIRERAHEKLDELFDMYERGDPLWLVSECGWITDKFCDELHMTIKERW
jgi:hypothetical protein